jgi:hypothetical protein
MSVSATQKTKKSSYDTFKELRELMRMESVTSPDGSIRLSFSKMVQTGEFELFDYGQGFLFVDIYSMVVGDGKSFVRVFISTIDDGGWGAWSQSMTLEQANELVVKVKDVFDVVTLPSEAAINEQLRPFGLYGTNE